MQHLCEDEVFQLWAMLCWGQLNSFPGNSLARTISPTNLKLPNYKVLASELEKRESFDKYLPENIRKEILEARKQLLYEDTSNPPVLMRFNSKPEGQSSSGPTKVESNGDASYFLRFDS